eukprot:CAMPEP_0116923290 /NCGR_PEP_ID=MMETSP0467-20121206/22793_1 /TAXON_ID=283647 /ORGANISM="Mesodinium pulex, Strain SPMC105" /LENGTH=43 /DNA_ID= /DNA_START= /DNA_END= /DNA_ORIENTATION=
MFLCRTSAALRRPLVAQRTVPAGLTAFTRSYHEAVHDHFNSPR